MYQKDLIYDNAKEILKKYGRMEKKSVNEKVIYECAAIIYSIKQDCKEDTRSYSFTRTIYEIEKEMVSRLQKKIRHDEEYAKEAAEACRNTLNYIELAVRSKINLSSLAC